MNKKVVIVKKFPDIVKILKQLLFMNGGKNLDRTFVGNIPTSTLSGFAQMFLFWVIMPHIVKMAFSP